ncbi:hypothetical protein K458DRAFT_389312 [Lentithecium fluviatile CBS 122367]|uniref:Uncharacterized protein n=1 Tax=Lentithecium fluviatile CBS 122367 TaxID=1168545 RepID=A0A6G1J0Q9_9PLEO|nr:hypothetical protein K458DRAFT_389312 [Lentithecium fluviatile CBS 122367]
MIYLYWTLKEKIEVVDMREQELKHDGDEDGQGDDGDGSDFGGMIDKLYVTPNHILDPDFTGPHIAAEIAEFFYSRDMFDITAPLNGQALYDLLSGRNTLDKERCFVSEFQQSLERIPELLASSTIKIQFIIHAGFVYIHDLDELFPALELDEERSFSNILQAFKGVVYGLREAGKQFLIMHQNEIDDNKSTSLSPFSWKIYKKCLKASLIFIPHKQTNNNI